MASHYALSDQQKSFVERQIAEGRFASVQDVLSAALRLLEAKEDRLAALDRMLAQGRADLDAGADRDAAEVFDALEQRFAPAGRFHTRM